MSKPPFLSSRGAWIAVEQPHADGSVSATDSDPALPLKHAIEPRVVHLQAKLGRPANWSEQKFADLTAMLRQSMDVQKTLFPTEFATFAASVRDAEDAETHGESKLASAAAAEFLVEFSSSAAAADAIAASVEEQKKRKALFVPFGYSVVFEPSEEDQRETADRAALLQASVASVTGAAGPASSGLPSAELAVMMNDVLVERQRRELRLSRHVPKFKVHRVKDGDAAQRPLLETMKAYNEKFAALRPPSPTLPAQPRCSATPIGALSNTPSAAESGVGYGVFYDRNNVERVGNIDNLLANDKCEWEGEQLSDDFMLVCDETQQLIDSGATIEFDEAAEMRRVEEERTRAEKVRRERRPQVAEVQSLRSLGVVVPPTPAEIAAQEKLLAQKATEEAAAVAAAEQARRQSAASVVATVSDEVAAVDVVGGCPPAEAEVPPSTTKKLEGKPPKPGSRKNPPTQAPASPTSGRPKKTPAPKRGADAVATQPNAQPAATVSETATVVTSAVAGEPRPPRAPRGVRFPPFHAVSTVAPADVAELSQRGAVVVEFIQSGDLYFRLRSSDDPPMSSAVDDGNNGSSDDEDEDGAGDYFFATETPPPTPIDDGGDIGSASLVSFGDGGMEGSVTSPLLENASPSPSSLGFGSFRLQLESPQQSSVTTHVSSPLKPPPKSGAVVQLAALKQRQSIASRPFLAGGSAKVMLKTATIADQLEEHHLERAIEPPLKIPVKLSPLSTIFLPPQLTSGPRSGPTFNSALSRQLVELQKLSELGGLSPHRRRTPTPASRGIAQGPGGPDWSAVERITFTGAEAVEAVQRERKAAVEARRAARDAQIIARLVSMAKAVATLDGQEDADEGSSNHFPIANERDLVAKRGPFFEAMLPRPSTKQQRTAAAMRGGQSPAQQLADRRRAPRDVGEKSALSPVYVHSGPFSASATNCPRTVATPLSTRPKSNGALQAFVASHRKSQSSRRLSPLRANGDTANDDGDAGVVDILRRSHSALSNISRLQTPLPPELGIGVATRRAATPSMAKVPPQREIGGADASLTRARVQQRVEVQREIDKTLQAARWFGLR